MNKREEHLIDAAKSGLRFVAVEQWAIEDALKFLPRSEGLRPIGLENYFRDVLQKSGQLESAAPAAPRLSPADVSEGFLD
jgi:hypothetical protein